MLRTNPETAHYEIDPARLDLALEFRRYPKGPHSAELQKVVHRMRWSGAGGRYCLIPVEPGRRWMLALLPERRGAPIRTFPETTFTSINDAEWHVFKIRWQVLAGSALPESLEDE
ncbi:hypothetical protein [uncultured Roseibium sp.]|uniref:hypothetical protein n=1 Tax=uncultured Roseibium sp. TaxID=1936171 RepID=UPI0032167453